jgi:RNA recognition motif-containing protein
LKSVYLSNLNYNTSSTDIYYLANDFGEIEYVDMPVKNDGKSNKGYCFVKFRDSIKAE